MKLQLKELTQKESLPSTSYGDSLLNSARLILVEPGVEDVAQEIAHQVDGDDDDDQEEARNQRDPPRARVQVLLADADQRAEAGLGHRHAEAEEGQSRLGDDGVGDLNGADDEDG